MTRSLALAAALLLAACQQAAAPANTAVPAEHGYIAKVAALSPREREGVLFRAIQSGGGATCQGIKKVEDLLHTPQGQPVWRVTCDDDYQWSVVLADDGTATVTGARTD